MKILSTLLKRTIVVITIAKICNVIPPTCTELIFQNFIYKAKKLIKMVTQDHMFLSLPRVFQNI